MRRSSSRKSSLLTRCFLIRKRSRCTTGVTRGLAAPCATFVHDACFFCAQPCNIRPDGADSSGRFGEAGVKGAGGGGGPGFQDFGDFSPFGDIFETFFGGGGGGGGGRSRRQQGPQQGDDLRLDLEIDFMTAVFGGEEKIRISHLETCDTCENVSTCVMMHAGSITPRC
jgi:hypothetical protein